MPVRNANSQTLQQRLGFSDKDLTTPEHDAIMIWLQEHLKEICAQLIGVDLDTGDWPPKQVIEAQQKAEAFTKGWPYRFKPGELPISLPEYPGRMDIDLSKWEFPIVSETARSKYVIGFVDLYAKVGWDPTISVECETAYEIPHNVSTAYSYLNVWQDWRHYAEYLFEIKPHITSLGELVRQIQLYRTYQKGRYIVVTDDDKYRGILEDQGIRLIKYT